MSGWTRIGITALDLAYFVVAITVLVYAIRALSPTLRPYAGHFRNGISEPVSDASGGVVLFRDALKYSRDGYQQAWRNLTDEQLSAELAGLFHMLAGRAHQKHDSLRHLYGGLVVLLVLGAAMFLLAGLFAVFDQPA